MSDYNPFYEESKNGENTDMQIAKQIQNAVTNMLMSDSDSLIQFVLHGMHAYAIQSANTFIIHDSEYHFSDSMRDEIGNIAMVYADILEVFTLTENWDSDNINHFEEYPIFIELDQEMRNAVMQMIESLMDIDYDIDIHAMSEKWTTDIIAEMRAEFTAIINGGI